MKYKNKKVIITGGSRGIGLAVAKAFLREGAHVLSIARDRKELEKLKKQLEKINGVYAILQVDVSKSAKRAKVKKYIKNKFNGAIDILINAAGIYGPIGYLEENNKDLWEKTFKVNVFGTVHMCALTLPFMKKQKWGRIINFSGGGDGPFPRFTSYSASKGAIVRFTESLAAEVKDFGITVNTITPGGVNTKFLQDVLDAGPEKVGKEFYRRSLEQKKEGGVSPKLAAELILYLTNDNTEFLSGKVISANRDNWKDFKKYKNVLESSDVYTIRRIKPQDRGYEW